MKTYTKEEKQAYQLELRNKWKEIKDAVDQKQIDEIKAVIAEHGLNVSPYSYAFVERSMAQLGYDGIPYLDCKTFHGWKERGFMVRCGEQSKIKGIVWIHANQEKEVESAEDLGYAFPKMYHLFHRSQVEEMAVKNTAAAVASNLNH